MITIQQARFEEWEPWVANILKRLCFQDGVMGDEVRYYPKTLTWVAFDGDKPVAWSLVSKTSFHAEWSLMLYTNTKYRRRGIGRQLYQAVMKWHKTLPNSNRYPTRVFTDWENRGFFKRIGRNYDFKVGGVQR
jgi:GNAT superfamily N-acetyltransferase